MQIAPIDVAEIIKAIFYGVAALCVPVGTVYIMIGAARAKRAETASVAAGVAVKDVKDDLSKVKDNVQLIERNTNSLTTQLKASSHRNGVVEGKRIGDEHGEDLAKKLAQGQQEGRDNERASVAAADKKVSIVSEPKAHGMGGSGNEPIPVEDEAAAEISKSIAKATAESAAAAIEINKRVAVAQERSADALQQTADTTKEKQ